jgi:DNA relaxase NicK
MPTHPGKQLIEPHTIDSAGVDWITCTQSREFPEKHLRDIAFNLLESEESAGNKCSPWSSRGYVGYQAGGVRIGVRPDSWCVQLSSSVARDNWKQVYDERTNLSRIDVQTTVQFETSQPYIIKTLHRDALEPHKRPGRPSERRLISSTTKGDTLYIGRRVSQVYLRAYDKGVEQQSHEAGKLLRYEAELKGDRARQIAASIYKASSEWEASHALISQLFRREHVRVPRETLERQWDSLSLRTPDATRKLAWVRSSVQPSIKFLLLHVERDEIMDALGLSSPERPETNISEGE